MKAKRRLDYGEYSTGLRTPGATRVDFFTLIDESNVDATLEAAVKSLLAGNSVFIGSNDPRIVDFLAHGMTHRLRFHGHHVPDPPP